jgi:hypothetical protein
MREVLGAGRGVQAGEVEIRIRLPAMAAETGRETRQGAESDEESDGCDRGHKIDKLSRKALPFAPRSLLPIKFLLSHTRLRI